MSCFEVRASISAALDGEEVSLPEPVVVHHLVGCVKCRLWSADVTDLHRSLRVQPAPIEPDRTASIVAALPSTRGRTTRGRTSRGRTSRHRNARDESRRDENPRPGMHDDRVRVLRIVTVMIALVQLVASLPLLFGSSYEMHGHLARHVGVFSVAIVAGLFIVAWRPDRARATLPILAVLVVGLVWSCLGDLLAGRPLPGSVVAHAADVAGLCTVWLIARTTEEAPSVRHHSRPVLG